MPTTLTPDAIAVPPEKIPIERIANPLPDRNVSPHLVDELADSMEEIGLLNPVIVTPDLRLVAGRQRLAAAKQLGWTEIRATIIDGMNEADIATLDENIVRSQLSHLEFAEALARRKAIHEQLHPDTVAGSPALMRRLRTDQQASGLAFVDDMVRRTGWSRSKYDRLLRIVDAIEPETRDLLRSTPVANKLQDLFDLMDIEPERRQAIARRLHDGEISRVAQGLTTSEDPREPKPQRTADTPELLADAGSPSIVQRRAFVVRAAVEAACREHDIDMVALGLDVDVTPDGKSRVQVALPAPVGEPALLVALRIIGDIAAESDRVHRIAADTAAEPAEWKQFASPADLVEMPAGQMQATWVDASRVEISRGGVPLSQIPVTRAAKSGTYVKPLGNTKTESVISVINGWSQGCGRGGTGLAKCDECCFTVTDFRTGCFAADTAYANHKELRGIYDICLNGLSNGLQKLNLPRNGSFALNADSAWGPTGRRIWRVDSESSDASLSIATGLLQMFAEQNERHLFYGISSNYFYPSDAMLRWLAALENVWVLHSVSAWFDPAETDMRFAAIERFLEFGVPTAVSIVTDPAWSGNVAILDRALKLVAPEAVSEAPHQIGKQFKHLPMFDHNRFGACGDNRFDRDGLPVHGEYTKSGKIRYYRLERGTKVPARGGAHPRCVGCRLLCGATALGFSGAAASACGSAAATPESGGELAA